MIDLTHDDITFLNQQLDDGATPEEAADALNRRLAMVAVQRVLRDRSQRAFIQEARTASLAYTFVTEHTLADGRRQLRQIRVKASQFSAFCEAHGLKESQMLRVNSGEIDSYKGYYQNLGGARAAAIHREEVHRENLDLREGAEREYKNRQQTMLREQKDQTPAVLPVEEWTPNAG